jgi:hypothetical protein
MIPESICRRLIAQDNRGWLIDWLATPEANALGWLQCAHLAWWSFFGWERLYTFRLAVEQDEAPPRVAIEKANAEKTPLMR